VSDIGVLSIDCVSQLVAMIVEKVGPWGAIAAHNISVIARSGATKQSSSSVQLWIASLRSQ
jgi:hypothetical protein